LLLVKFGNGLAEKHKNNDLAALSIGQYKIKISVQRNLLIHMLTKSKYDDCVAESRIALSF
jgi:hypothetical protein